MQDGFAMLDVVRVRGFIAQRAVASIVESVKVDG
jgi:hypothetical protein